MSRRHLVNDKFINVLGRCWAGGRSAAYRGAHGPSRLIEMQRRSSEAPAAANALAASADTNICQAERACGAVGALPRPQRPGTAPTSIGSKSPGRPPGCRSAPLSTLYPLPLFISSNCDKCGVNTGLQWSDSLHRTSHNMLHILFQTQQLQLKLRECRVICRIYTWYRAKKSENLGACFLREVHLCKSC
jgi:hypothetical protein